MGRYMNVVYGDPTNVNYKPPKASSTWCIAMLKHIPTIHTNSRWLLGRERDPSGS